MNDKTLVEMLAGWSDSEFAVAASGEYCEDLKSRIEGVSAAMNDKWCGDGLAESEQIAFMRSRIEALEAALRFYARENSWKSCGVYMSGQSQPSSAEVDRGNKARKALESQP